MRVKVGTILDEKILRQAKAFAARQGKSLGQLIEVGHQERVGHAAARAAP